MPGLILEAPEVEGRNVLVVGLGLFGGGVGAARYLARRGARVTVTDRKTEAELRESVEALRGLEIRFRLGVHDERDVAEADLVVVSPAVPLSLPLLAGARAIETELNLFMKLCRAETTLGITGSNGKTTTTTLVGEILRRRPGRTWVGGNIGGSLLERVDEIAREDLVVLELSSFQLENLGALRRSPSVAAILNLTPNHLDRHGTMEAYAEAKRQILAHQRAGDTRVINLDDPRLGPLAAGSAAKTYGFSLKRLPAAGAWARDGRIGFALPDAAGELDVSRRKLPGGFNLANMAAAALLSCPSSVGGWAWAAWRAACEEVFNAFPGVEHRLEFVAEKGGVKYYNDSKSSDAEATIAALEALPGPFVLILGGFDKKTPWEELARRVEASPVRQVVLMGQTAPAIEAALRTRARVPEILRVSSLEEAVRAPVRPGETLLLSPACASWDMFRNFEDRGTRFKALVAALPAV